MNYNEIHLQDLVQFLMILTSEFHLVSFSKSELGKFSIDIIMPINFILAFFHKMSWFGKLMTLFMLLTLSWCYMFIRITRLSKFLVLLHHWISSWYLKFFLKKYLGLIKCAVIHLHFIISSVAEMQIAGNTTDFVNSVIAKVEEGDLTGGLSLRSKK